MSLEAADELEKRVTIHKEADADRKLIKYGVYATLFTALLPFLVTTFKKFIDYIGIVI